MTYNDERFNRDSKEFRVHWDMGREAARKANIKLNDMVAGLHEQHPDWSYTKIAKTLWIKHQDLDGFTTQTIRKKLDDDNQKLIDSSKQHPPTTTTKPEEDEDDNIVLEHSGPKDPDLTDQKVIEDSSTIGDSEDEEEEEEKGEYQPSSELEEKFRKQHGTTIEQEQEGEPSIKPSSSAADDSTIDENNPRHVEYLINKYEIKLSNAKSWISHYEKQVIVLEREITRLKNKVGKK